MHHSVQRLAEARRIDAEDLTKFAKDNPELGAYDDRGELWISNWHVDTLLKAYNEKIKQL